MRYCTAVLSFVSMLVFFACSNGHQAEGEQELRDGSPAECFLFLQGRDSIKLALMEKEQQVSGRLSYLFYETDKSYGSVEGVLAGDTVFVTYSFRAEGTFSYRELAFLRRGDSLLVGSGEIVNEGNRDRFMDRSSITYTSGIVLHKISCEKLQWRRP